MPWSVDAMLLCDNETFFTLGGSLLSFVGSMVLNTINQVTIRKMQLTVELFHFANSYNQLFVNFNKLAMIFNHLQAEYDLLCNHYNNLQMDFEDS
ncbi:hypothetical protein FRB97_003938 [Tulasnella sp. 331]|nr:hypothetical protein FRB97_003938 [Tulasnella sp. 331]